MPRIDPCTLLKTLGVRSSAEKKRRMAFTITENLKMVSTKVSLAYTSSSPELRALAPPRLVAVSKTKPKELIIEAYEAGQRHFGENYIQELCAKSTDPEILEQCPEIKWHFIGACQSNKAKDLVGCPNLSMVETVTSEKLADKLNSQAKNLQHRLPVMIQVNTSGEANKNGVEPEATIGVFRHINTKCDKLKFGGLMTIGALARSLAAKDEEDNPDFRKLLEVRNEICTSENVKASEVELSMGMSNDYEEAISLGSTNVRVGSSIFGSRNYPPQKPGVESSPGNVGGVGTVETVTTDMSKVSV